MKLVIVDDHEIFRLGLRALLETEAGFEVIGEVGDLESANRLLKELNPDVVILDQSFPDSSGLDAIDTIRRRLPDVKVVMLTASRAETVLMEAIAIGVDAIVHKQDSSEELIDSLHALSEEKQVISSSIKPLIKRATALSQLTRRERQILRFIANGYRNREISEKLHISLKTVDTHRTNMMRKLNLHSVAEIVDFSNKLGLIDPSI